jgi:hypothetical protein
LISRRLKQWFLADMDVNVSQLHRQMHLHQR